MTTEFITNCTQSDSLFDAIFSLMVLGKTPEGAEPYNASKPLLTQIDNYINYYLNKNDGEHCQIPLFISYSTNPKFRDLLIEYLVIRLGVMCPSAIDAFEEEENLCLRRGQAMGSNRPVYIEPPVDDSEYSKKYYKKINFQAKFSDKSGKMIYGAILAGGVGKRIERYSYPKQFIPVGGTPIIILTSYNWEDIEQEALEAKEEELDAFVKRVEQEALEKKREAAVVLTEEKYQEEMMNLYAKENASPTAGCLPMLITMLVLFALIEVVYNPLYYVTNVNKDDLENSNKLISNLYNVSYETSRADSDETTFADILAKIEKDNEGISEDKKYEKLKSTLEDNEKIEKLELTDKQWERVISAIKLHNDIDTEFMLNEDYITKNLAKSRPALLNFSFLNKAGGKYADVIDIVDDSGKLRETIDDFDYTFFGIKLESFPKWNGFSKDSLLVLVPILSFVFQLIMTFVSQYYTKKNNPSAADAMGGMKVMLYIMPIFSLIITFNFPVGLGIYWVMSSVVGLGQTVFLNTVYTPEHVEELIKKEDAKKKKSGKKSFMERALEAQQQGLEGRKNIPSDDKDDEEETEEKKLSKAELKELQRKKLNEARKRMAEKYGDEYKED